MKNRTFQHFDTISAEEFRRRAPEKSIQSAICGVLRLLRIPFSVTDAAFIFDDRGEVAGRAVLADGWPDISAVLPGGQYLGIETKTATGRLRPSQIACHLALRQAGALVIVPRRVEEIARLLKDVGIEHPILNQLISTEGGRK